MKDNMSRNTLTLGFKKNKKDEDSKISNTGLEMLAERQRLIKEAQAKKLAEQKAAATRKDFYKKSEVKKEKENLVNIKTNEKNAGKDKNFEKKEKDNFKKKNNKYHKDSNKKNFSNKDGNNYKSKEDKKFNNKKNLNDKKEHNKNDKEEKNTSELQQNFNEINSNKKLQYKEKGSKSPRFKESNYEDGGGSEKNSKRILKNKDDKYSKNIHTYIFNEEDDDNDNVVYDNLNRSIRAKKRDKKNIQQGFEQQKIYQTVNIPEFISVSDLAERMNEKKSDIIKKLMTMGMRVTVNQIIDADTAELIVVEFGHTPNRVLDSDIENVLKEKVGTNFVPRSPVVTVMGHVDHGKTSLLDALRATKVAEGESGGITQHIGASRIEVTKNKFITFIDTPGHEAFTEMRMRGANITDIVVLVVAADDGVKDQTIEAINHTKAAKVPMIVAINKIDKEGIDPSRVKNELLQHGVIVEEFGGDVIFVEVSAKNRINLDKLIDAILLQAEILDLKAPIDCPASGAVIESKMDSQRGVVTTVLIQKGILSIGDIVLAGTSYGKVKRMVDDKKKTQNQAYPSMAVEILGLDTTPKAGVVFNVIENEKSARDIISYRENKEREAKEAKRAGKSVESILQQVKGSNKKQLYLIVKGDVSGSIEAITSSLLKLSNDNIDVDIIHSAIGSITESDINLASASNAIIIAFNVRAINTVRDLAKEKDVEIKYYSIIYDIINDVKSIMSGFLDPIIKEKVIGQAEIRNVIKISGVGKIAGCYVLDGEVRRNANIRLIRDGVVIFDGIIKTLKRFKEDVKEVKNNYECGIAIENYDDIKEKDIIECYEKVEEKGK